MDDNFSTSPTFFTMQLSLPKVPLPPAQGEKGPLQFAFSPDTQHQPMNQFDIRERKCQDLRSR